MSKQELSVEIVPSVYADIYVVRAQEPGSNPDYYLFQVEHTREELQQALSLDTQGGDTLPGGIAVNLLSLLINHLPTEDDQRAFMKQFFLACRNLNFPQS